MKSVSLVQRVLYQNQEVHGMKDSSSQDGEKDTPLNQKTSLNESQGCTQHKTKSNSSQDVHIQNGIAGDMTLSEKESLPYQIYRMNIYLMTLRK